VYSRKYQFIGMLDIEAKIDGKLSVDDLKTSNGIYNTTLQQTAAYQYAAEEEAEFLGKPVKYETRHIIRLAKETEKEYVARMEKKNAVKMLQGKNVGDIKPYEPFEFMEIEGRETYERDFEGFKNSIGLFRWNKETDFYLNKKK